MVPRPQQGSALDDAPAPLAPLIEELERRDLMAAKLTAVLGADGVLAIEGTARADQVVVQQVPAGSGPISIQGVKIVDGKKVLDKVDARCITRITVQALGGDDTVNLSGIPRPCAVHGGPGHDALVGGSGDDLLAARATTTRSRADSATTP